MSPYCPAPWPAPSLVPCDLSWPSIHSWNSLLPLCPRHCPSPGLSQMLPSNKFRVAAYPNWMLCTKSILASLPFPFSQSVPKWTAFNSQLQWLIITLLRFEPEVFSYTHAYSSVCPQIHHVHLNVFRLFKNRILLIPTWAPLALQIWLPLPGILRITVKLPHLATWLTHCVWLLWCSNTTVQ